MTSMPKRHRAPLRDSIIFAVASLVDDAQSDRREPSHSDIEFEITRAGLGAGDPKTQGQTVGKAKRVRATLSWALEHAPDDGEVCLAGLISMVRAKGGFRRDSPNFVGEDQIINAAKAFAEAGFVLSPEGELLPTAIDTLSGSDLTVALEAYVHRARRGSEDAALLVGTGKDLLEATAAHVITERFGAQQHYNNFPTLLGQAFTALGLATTQTPQQSGEPPQLRLQRALYEAGCSVNALRNKQGTGHGRPWLPTVSDTDARAAIQLMGIVAGLLLATHKEKP